MDDEELDDLFREAAAKANAPDKKEEVWNKLQEKLDALPPLQSQNPDPKKYLPWRRMGFRNRAALVIIVLFVLGFFTWQISRKYLNRSENSTAFLPGNKKKDTNQNSVIQPSKSAKENELTPLSGNPENINQATAEYKIQQSRVQQINNNQVRIEPNLGNDVPVIFSFPALEKKPLAIPENINYTPAQGFIRINKTENVYAAKPEPSLPEMPHWLLGLTAGPELSSVAGRSWQSGFGEGLKLAYRFNKKWALSTGVLVYKKNYNALPEDYNPDDNSWQKRNVKYIEAKCGIIDVPLNIEYTLWEHAKNNIFLSTGLSSVWMLEEKYSYYYKTSSGKWKDWNEELYNSNHHLFSILNCSAGYRKSWNKFSFEISPYIKLPLGGIGHGNVKLCSTGIYFTLQYKLN